VKRVAIGLVFAATLGGCTGYMHFDPMGSAYDGSAYDDAVAMTRGNSACDDARGRASTDPASGCVVSRRGSKK
jgi:hypothetical protein